MISPLIGTCRNIAEHQNIRHTIPLDELESFGELFLSHLKENPLSSLVAFTAKIQKPPLIAIVMPYLQKYFETSKRFLRKFKFV